MPAVKTPSEFIEDAFDNGHASGTLAEASAALWKAYTKADLSHRQTLVADLITLTTQYARECHGWEDSAAVMDKTLTLSCPSF